MADPAGFGGHAGAADVPVHARDFDVNGDGYTDLVVGAPGESVGTIAGAGLVHVIRGSASGPTAAVDGYWTQDTSGVSGVAEALDRFGDAVASGDFDSDGCADLAVGVPGEDVGSIADAGLVTVFHGSAAGLSAARSRAWTQDSTGVADGCEPGDRFGEALAVGDVNGDRFDDLLIGVPGEGLSGIAHAGAIHVLLGSPTGLTAGGSQFWSQDSPGMPDLAQQPRNGFEQFGATLAMGDVNTDGRADVAVGVPGEVTVRGNGVVHVLRGSPAGLSATGTQLLSAQTSSAGWPPANQPGFGVSLVMADLNGDRRADLAVGTPTGSIASGGAPVGTVATLAAGSSGSFGPATVWHLDREDLPGAGQAGGGFGAALATGDVTGDRIKDLIIGAPGARVGTGRDAGAVYLLIGSSLGPRASARVISQDVGIVPSSAELGDTFGASLASGHFSAATADWLAVGAPGEGIGTSTAEGTVTLLPGGSGGPDPAAARAMDQDSPGIVGTGEDFDRWGTLDPAGAAAGPPIPQGLARRIVTALPTTDKVVALTFDCGASAAGVASILATLDSRDVLATFFPTGDFATRYPDSVRTIAAAGHRIGNHSASHPEFPTLTPAQQAAQVRSAEASIRPLSGRSTLPWFRFPYGASNASALSTVGAEGFVALGWTVDTLGWKGTSGGQSVSSVIERVVATARPGQVVLMHVGANPDDGSTLDADALPTVIDRLTALGYSFLTIDAALR
jgi:peptidoglycan/xylan/chitin deacetylase (PgdA/CDA1 family)